jgi:predicted hydrolase (HD superfamily)
MQWALYTCDELTGLIVAVALVKPEKKLSSVTVDSVMKKWNSKSFAAGVDRKQIEECTPRLGIELRDFIQIALTAMQSISMDLGL